MSERVELRMKCPVCGVRNHSVTFLADGPTTYHDCGHTTADHLLPVPGPSSPPPVELSPEAIEQIQRYRHGQQSDTLLGVPAPQEMTVKEARLAQVEALADEWERVGGFLSASQLQRLRAILHPEEYEGSFPPPEACPECVQGKHGNCDGTAWDDKADAPTACPCEKRGHQ